MTDPFVYGFTGIVCKRKDSPYAVTEKPSRYWIKVKNFRYSQLEGREELFERAQKQKYGFAVIRQGELNGLLGIGKHLTTFRYKSAWTLSLFRLFVRR